MVDGSAAIADQIIKLGEEENNFSTSFLPLFVSEFITLIRAFTFACFRLQDNYNLADGEQPNK